MGLFDSGETVDVIDDRLEHSQTDEIESQNLYENEDWLYLNYVVLDKSASELAKDVAVEVEEIKDLIEKHEISKNTSQSWIKNAPWRKKEWLEREYIENKKSTADIAEEWDITKTTVRTWMLNHGIKLRSMPDAIELWHDKHGVDAKYKDEEWLYQQYHSFEKSTEEIADETGTEGPTIVYWLNKFEIPTRSASESARLGHGKEVRLEGNDAELYLKQKGVTQNDSDATYESIAGSDERITEHSGLSSYTGPAVGLDGSYSDLTNRSSIVVDSPWREKQWLELMYKKYNDVDEIADICDVGRTTIYRWMSRLEIDYEKYGPKYSLDEFISAVRSCADELGEPLKKTQYMGWARNQGEAVPTYFNQVESEGLSWKLVGEKAGVTTPKMEVDCPTGDELRTLREEVGFSKTALGEWIGSTGGMISLVESGEHIPKMDLGQRIADIDWDYLKNEYPIDCPRGQELRQLREDAGLTLKELSEEANLNVATIRKLENTSEGVRRKTKKKIDRLDWEQIKQDKQQRLECPTGGEFRELRKDAGATIKEVANAINSTQLTVRLLEAGEHEPNERLAKDIRNLEWDQLEGNQRLVEECPTGKELRGLRKTSGYSMEQLEDEIGVSSTAILSIERGGTPSLKNARKLNGVDWQELADSICCPVDAQLRELRKILGMSRDEFASEAGIDINRLRSVEEGTLEPEWDDAVAINSIKWKWFDGEINCPKGEELRELRQQAGLSQPELAEMVGYTSSPISNIERGIDNPSIEMASALNAIDWEFFIQKQQRLSSCPTGEDLKELRTEAGLKQRELGDHIGVSQTVIYSIESDRRNPTEEVAESILKIDWEQLKEEYKTEIECPSGEELRKLRKECGLTQIELADRIGYSAESVRAVEKGDRSVSENMASELNAVEWDRLVEE